MFTSWSTMNMIDWAPFVESALNSCHDEVPYNGNANCNQTSQTQTKTQTLCWNETIQYNATIANSNVCQLKYWAQTNRPATIFNTNQWGETKWRISHYDYEHTAGHPCENHCSHPVPLTLTVTYTKFKCSYIYESNHELSVATFDVPNGTGGTGVLVGEGHVLMDFKLEPDDPRDPNPFCQELRIIGPDGVPYMSVYPGEPDANGNQHVEWEMVDYSLTDCTYEFIEGS